MNDQHSRSYRRWYLRHHGLHVFDDKFEKSCALCRLRAKIIAFARFKGIDPQKALEDPIFISEVEAGNKALSEQTWETWK